MARDTDTPATGATDGRPGDEPAGSDTGAVEPPVRLLIPSSVRHLRLARVTASTMASDLSFDLQDIEDLRVAVDELAALAIEDCPPDAVLELRFDAVDGGLRINGTIAAPGLPAPTLHPVARELLGLVADEYTFSPDGDIRSFELLKRHRRPEA